MEAAANITYTVHYVAFDMDFTAGTYKTMEEAQEAARKCQGLPRNTWITEVEDNARVKKWHSIKTS